MPSPVLVTGSTGFLGSALVRALRADGSPVRGVDVRPSATTDLVADLLDDGAWQDAAQEAPVVVHTAALVGERGRRARFEALNVEAFVQRYVGNGLGGEQGAPCRTSGLPPEQARELVGG